MLRDVILRTIERTYRSIPISQTFKRRLRDFAFTRFGRFFAPHPAYQLWRNRSDEASSNDEQMWSRYGKFPSITAPTKEEWSLLLSQIKGARNVAVPIVDVIIPVYDGYDETLRAIYNAVKSSNRTSHEVIIITDCGPNRTLNSEIESLALQGLFTLVKNDTNLGFVQTVNRGFRLHSERDVLILNADAFVNGDYLDRLRAHALQGHVATVTPFTSNGEICSYPIVCRDNSWKLELADEELDSIAAEVNRGRSVHIPTGVGFCMYITRQALNEVGFFDAEAFGKGYGEENDFCVRASQRGYTHLLAGDVYVRHAGGVSFSERKLQAIQRAMQVMEERHPGYNSTIQSYIARDPATALRRRLDIARLKRTSNAPLSFLYIFHTWGGGTEKHARDMAKWLEDENVAVFTLQPCESNSARCQLGNFGKGPKLNIPNLEFDISEETAICEALAQLQIAHIHIQHLVGYDERYYALLPQLATRLGIALDITVHDYFPFCPRIHLIGSSGKYCGEPDVISCTACVKHNGAPPGAVDVGEWRARYAQLFSQARKIFVPDIDVSTRLSRYFDGVTFTVRPHPETWKTTNRPSSPPKEDKIRVALIGALFELKGAKVLRALVEDAHARKLPLEFHLIGYYGVYDPQISTFPNLLITGKYEESEVGNLIEASGAKVALFPAVWPETFSYTLSLAYQHGLFPISFDLGAPANRIRASGWGQLWPIEIWDDAPKMNDLLCALSVPPRPEQLAIFDKNDTYPSLVRNYYDLGAILPSRREETCRSPLHGAPSSNR
jgi:GT2 family glycosyltransferase